MEVRAGVETVTAWVLGLCGLEGWVGLDANQGREGDVSSTQVSFRDSLVTSTLGRLFLSHATATS
jgi:hypothetical protein